MKKSKWVVLLLMVMFVFGGCGASTKESEGITQNRSTDTAAVSFESEGEKARLDARETQVQETSIEGRDFSLRRICGTFQF